jgi:glucosyl-dolichyl phosphate glucuronosyltransferase
MGRGTSKWPRPEWAARAEDNLSDRKTLSMSDPALTVLFATRNGEDVLPRTLAAYCRVEAPRCRWKIVVVDNGSQDSTADILTSFKRRLPLEMLQQSIVGKNRALNHGLSVLEGSLAIITDDDAIPEPSFLTAWSRYVDEAQDYELFGGSIDPLFEASPPKWILRNKARFDLLFAVRNLPEGPIAPDEIFGPNMAVRRAVFARGFRFNENIGPNGFDPQYAMGSETEFCCRVARNGAKAWYAEHPRVQHVVRRSQLARSYWAKRAYRHGRGVAQQEWELGLKFATEPKVDRPSRLRHLAKAFAPSPLLRFNNLWDYHWRLGFRDEWDNRSATEKGPGKDGLLISHT